MALLWSLLNSGKVLSCLFGTYSPLQGTFSLAMMPGEGDEPENMSHKRQQAEQAPMC